MRTIRIGSVQPRGMEHLAPFEGQRDRAEARQRARCGGVQSVKPCRCFYVLALLVTVALPYSAESREDPMQVCIVRPEGAPWLVEHAADELARYVKAMTGADVRLAQRLADCGHADTTLVLAVGPAGEALKRLPGAGDPARLRDGFVIRSGGPGQLKIAALEPIGLLYGVYHYLERQCGVGFFWDGDHVPHRASLPTDGVDDAELPRWPVRHFGFAFGWGLSKWHHQFRAPEERRRLVDWMAKRGLNRGNQVFSPNIAQSGVSAARVFGISDREPDNFTFAGWPGCLDFPAEVRTRITKDQLDYGRKLGLEWVYYLAYGNVPHQFRTMHPDYRYVDQLGYSATVLYPDDPKCREWTEAFYRDVIATYGTDHIYVDSPFVESPGATDPEQSFQLKLSAAKQMCEVFKAIDPQAVWGSDSWDFGALPQVWSDERISRYYADLPRDMMLVYDTAGLENPFYKRTGYFKQTPWAFGILHSFQGDDHLHGDLSHALAAIQDVSADPQAERCIGIYHVPETSGHNVLFFDLTTQLAWQPDGVTVDGFVGDYVRRRYGEQDAPRMLSAVNAMVDAVYRGGGQMPIYHKLGCGYGPWWWPIVDEHRSADDARPAITAAAAKLRDAVEAALACRESQTANPLYENDLVDWARTYLAHVFNWAVLDAYDAFGHGDAPRLRRSADLARQCLRHVAAILSTRPDFWLQPQIDRCTAVPGANPHLAWYMKQHCINDLYSANEVYEQLHWYYGPRMEVYLSELESRAAAGTRNVAWADIADRCNAIQARWLDQDIRVPDHERYHGAPLNAVEAAMRAVALP